MRSTSGFIWTSPRIPAHPLSPGMLALTPLVLALSALALPAQHERDFLGLLGDDSDTSTTFLSPHHTLKTTTTSSASPSVKSTLQSSVEQPSPTSSAEPTTVNIVIASTPSILPASAESNTDHSSKTWQIIGIAIIVVLFIATSITCAMFFDRLWRFLKDVIGCTSRPPASEEFIPDCDTRSLSPSLSDWNHCKSDEAASMYPTRARDLPWNTLHRHPSRRNDPPPPA